MIQIPKNQINDLQNGRTILLKQDIPQGIASFSINGINWNVAGYASTQFHSEGRIYTIVRPFPTF